MAITDPSFGRWGLTELHVVVDPDVVGDDVVRSRLGVIAEALGTVRVRATLQLRIKTRPERIAPALSWLRTFRGFDIAINGARWDDAHGVHLPEADIAPVRAPRLGASVHSREALEAAEAAGVDYVFFGPVYDARSKPVPGVGTEALAIIARSARVPVIAIGGVTPARVAACLRAGAAGVAVLTGVLGAEDPAAVIRELSLRLEEATECRT